MSDGIEFRCPFCFALAKAADNPPIVLHTVPMCKQFRDKNPAEYLEAVNDTIAGTSQKWESDLATYRKKYNKEHGLA